LQDLEFDRIFLPDLSNPQRLSVTSTLADLKLGFTLHDGWMLTSLSVDSQSVADKIASATMTPALLAAASSCVRVTPNFFVQQWTW
jgi:hypothetical protein